MEFKTTSEANTFHGSCCTVGMKEKKLSGEAVRAQLSRTLALAGCDCSERANVGKVFPPSAPFSSSFSNFRSSPSAGASCPPRDDELSFSAQGRRDDEAGEKSLRGRGVSGLERKPLSKKRRNSYDFPRMDGIIQKPTLA